MRGATASMLSRICIASQMAGYEVVDEQLETDESAPVQEKESPAAVGGLDTPSHHAIILSRDRAMKDFKAFCIEQVSPTAI